MSIYDAQSGYLLHNYEHTTHHLALIRIGLTLLGTKVQIPENLGTAKSTLMHRNE